MRIVEFFATCWNPLQRRRLQGLAELLALESRPKVWLRLQPRVGQLGSEAEAAGYIRVRARDLVCCELVEASRRCGRLSPRRAHQVLELALAILIGHFTGPMLRPQEVVVPLRRAA